MSWQVIKQPDGKLGIYSSVVGDWIAKDLEADEVVEELFAEDMGADVARRLRRVRQIVQWVQDGHPGKAYHQFAMSYDAANDRGFDEDDEDEPVSETRKRVLRESCSACMEGAHAACTSHSGAFGGPCYCQVDQHATLLAEPATADELAAHLA